MTNRFTPVVAGLLLLGTYTSLADDLEEFLDCMSSKDLGQSGHNVTDSSPFRSA